MTEPGASQKSPDAYRTISEVAADLKLPQHVLRFWETRFPQVKPLKRAGGRRFYRPEDVDLLRAVKALLYGDGYTIKGVQRILREQGPKAVAALAGSPSRAGPPRPSAAKVTDPDIEAGLRLSASAPIPSPDPIAVAMPVVGRPSEPELRPEADASRDAAERLRTVLAELGECARLLAGARAASR